MQGDLRRLLAGEAAPAWTADPSVCVVLAAAGYPGKPRVVT
jgi:phosphoribosylamine-glycine ligase